jgi:hypothetical protein
MGALRPPISLRAAVVLLATIAISPCGAASLHLQELQILGKALSFLEPPLTGQSEVAIVYASGDAESLQNAKELAAQLKMVRLGGVPVVSRVVGSESLGGETFRLIITADGADGKSVIEAALANHALCVTANVDAVRVGQCTMAIRSAGKVEIFVNRQVATQSGIGFATAFRMMVHEQ